LRGKGGTKWGRDALGPKSRTQGGQRKLYERQGASGALKRKIKSSRTGGAWGNALDEKKGGELHCTKTQTREGVNYISLS